MCITRIYIVFFSDIFVHSYCKYYLKGCLYFRLSINFFCYLIRNWVFSNINFNCLSHMIGQCGTDTSSEAQSDLHRNHCDFLIWCNIELEKVLQSISLRFSYNCYFLLFYVFIDTVHLEFLYWFFLMYSITGPTFRASFYLLNSL